MYNGDVRSGVKANHEYEKDSQRCKQCYRVGEPHCGDKTPLVAEYGVRDDEAGMENAVLVGVPNSDGTV